MMTLQDIQTVFTEYWRPGWGSIAPDEALYIQSLITRHRPKHFLEIGTASGMSSGLIATFMENTGGETLTTIDHDNTFFGDKSKENGFLINQIYKGDEISISRFPFKTSLDVPHNKNMYDMAFIDANHQHPWPTIDTACIYPYLKGSKIVVHHDLRLFQKQEIVYGIGPKYLYDQFPDRYRNRSSANDGNIFYVDLSLSQMDFESIIADAFCLPWTLRTPLQSEQITKFQLILERYYSDELSKVFGHCLKKFNSYG